MSNHPPEESQPESGEARHPRPLLTLGELELFSVSGGEFQIDGGTMFGVVPKALWQRAIPADDRNRIPQQTNCLLIRGPGGCTLIDTGLGGHLSDRQRKVYGITAPGHPLLRNLAALGISPGDITTVVLTHLHFDHAGGGVVADEAGELVPAFPRAEYVVQRGEWSQATAGFPELRAAYPQENLQPLEHAGQLRLMDGDGEILPGLSGRVTGGHTQFHMALEITGGGQTALYPADVCPTQHHLPALWCMSYDTSLLDTRRIKPQLLGQAADAGWWVLFDHDPACAAARIVRDDRRGFATTAQRPVVTLPAGP